MRPLIQRICKRWGVVLVCLAAAGAMAQTEPKPDEDPKDPPAEPDDSIEVKLRDGTVIELDSSVLDGSIAGNPGEDGVVRPERPERPELSPEIRDRLERFRLLREAYLKEQREKLSGLTDEERDKIRERFRQDREAWMERARQIREEFRERQQQLLRELPAHREVLDDARESVRDTLRESLEEVGDRRGLD